MAEFDGEVVVDSMRIVERIGSSRPTRRSTPEIPPPARAQWFNEVWKGADGYPRLRAWIERISLR